MGKSRREIIQEDLRLSVAGLGIKSSARQVSLSLLKALLIPALVLNLGGNHVIGALPAHLKAEKETRGLSSQADKSTQGSVLVIGQDHFDVKETIKALPEMAKAGAKIFAMELPSDYTKSMQTYLQSPRTQEDRIRLTNETFVKTELSPEVVEYRRDLKERLIESITGVKSPVGAQEIIDTSLTEAAKFPDQWVGTAKLALEMMEKAHDAGMLVVCIDQDSTSMIIQKTENGINTMGVDADFAKRNAIMAGNLMRLTQKGNVVAAVGAAHTGMGNGKSVEAMTRKLGVKCISIDTDTPRPNSEVLRKLPTESLAKSDASGKYAREIVEAFQSLVGPKKPDKWGTLSGIEM